MAGYNFLKEISQNGKWKTRKMEKHRHLHMRGSLQRIPAVYVELNQEGFCGRNRAPGK